MRIQYGYFTCKTYPFWIHPFPNSAGGGMAKEGYVEFSRRLADHGPRERWQHHDRLLVAGTGEGRDAVTARVAEEHMLDRLAARSIINERARTAGLLLRADYQAAHLENRIIASYNIVRGLNAGGFQPYERSDAEEAAYQRWRRAVQSLPLREGGAVQDVCCFDRVPDARTLAALRRGLERLGVWYRLNEASWRSD